MKTFSNLITSLVISSWLIMIATFSIQNIQPVSLKFLLFESIKLPVGVMLTFSVALGMLIGSFVPLIWQLFLSQSKIEENS